MPNRAKTILDAVVAKLTGLATTGANVKASRAYNVPATPALTVFMGEEQEVSQSEAKVRKAREIKILIHVAEKEDLVDDKILQIEAEIWAALTADYTQGLSFVYETSFQSTSPFELEQGGKVSGQAEQTWIIYYSHSPTSMEA